MMRREKDSLPIRSIRHILCRNSRNLHGSGKETNATTKARKNGKTAEKKGQKLLPEKEGRTWKEKEEKKLNRQT